MTSNIHVTSIRNDGVYGHDTMHCDESGCAGDEHFYRFVDPTEVEAHHVYELDDDGRVCAEVE